MAETGRIRRRLRVLLTGAVIMTLSAQQAGAQVVSDSAADLRAPVATDAKLDEAASHGVVPLFPAGERAAGYTAKIMVIVQVDQRGSVSSATVESTDPENPALEKSALNYARALRFFPATRDKTGVRFDFLTGFGLSSAARS